MRAALLPIGGNPAPLPRSRPPGAHGAGLSALGSGFLPQAGKVPALGRGQARHVGQGGEAHPRHLERAALQHAVADVQIDLVVPARIEVRVPGEGLSLLGGAQMTETAFSTRGADWAVRASATEMTAIAQSAAATA